MHRYLTEPEQRALLNAPKRMADPLAVRDYHWMATLILSGMRIQEFCKLTAARVRLALQTGWLVSRKEDCKGKRRANDYLVTHQLRQHLQALLDLSDAIALEIPPHVERPAEQPLVWGRVIDGKVAALSVRSYEDRMKIWVGAANLDPRVSPHWLRHTRGMNVLRRTRGRNGLPVVQRALNHASLRSTGIYVAMSREDFEREIHLVDGGRVPRRLARQLAERAVPL